VLAKRRIKGVGAGLPANSISWGRKKGKKYIIYGHSSVNNIVEATIT
jgi:hypothetical protein